MAAYVELSQESFDDANAEQLDIGDQQYKFRFSLYWVKALSTAAITISLIAAILAIPKHIPHNNSNAFHFGCGDTPADAARLGCKFDLSAFVWVPPACFDSETMEVFLNSSDWRW
jgi:hypothetical protein